MRKLTCLSSFIIKIIALVTMAIDHVGLLLQTLYATNYNMLEIAGIFRIIGRLALPLFVFMIVEGVIHTKDIKKYLIRLGIMATLISVFFMVLEYSSFRAYAHGLLRAGNIFIDLTLVAISVYLLKQPTVWKKFLILLPISYSILCFVVKGVETSTLMDINWFPAFLTMQYDWFSLLLGIGFYLSYSLADTYIKVSEPTSHLDKEMWEQNGNYRLLANIISVFMLMLVSFMFYLTTVFWKSGVYWDANCQLYATISGAFILLYSGKRGYNAKWFQYGSYLYYPLHLVIIIIVFIIINGGL